jgi:hypothetical protein
MKENEVNRWEETVIGLMAVLSVIFIIVIWLASLSPVWMFTIYIADLMICIVFFWDFIRRIFHSQQKLMHLKYHGFELLSIVPVVAFYPVIQLSWICALLRLLRLWHAICIMGITDRFIQSTFRFIHRIRFT